VNPDLVALDKDGKPYRVRYDEVNAMLLNEFLKGARHCTGPQKRNCSFEGESLADERSA